VSCFVWYTEQHHYVYCALVGLYFEQHLTFLNVTMPAFSPFLFLLIQSTVHYIGRYAQHIIACFLDLRAHPILAASLVDVVKLLHNHINN
jgi:hypothetical protein